MSILIGIVIVHYAKVIVHYAKVIVQPTFHYAKVIVHYAKVIIDFLKPVIARLWMWSKTLKTKRC
jgi:hypothetical protein